MHFGGGQIDPEEIFNMFFSGGGPGMRFGGRGGRGAHFFHQNQRGGRQQQRGAGQQQRQQEAEGAGGLAGLFQILPIIVVILMSMTSFGGQSNYGPQYGIHQTQINVHQFKTSVNPYVMPGTPFYVSTDLRHKKMKGNVNSREWQQIESEVEQQYMTHLHAECGREKQRNMRFTLASHQTERCDRLKKARADRKDWEQALKTKGDAEFEGTPQSNRRSK